MTCKGMYIRVYKLYCNSYIMLKWPCDMQDYDFTREMRYRIQGLPYKSNLSSVTIDILHSPQRLNKKSVMAKLISKSVVFILFVAVCYYSIPGSTFAQTTNTNAGNCSTSVNVS